MKKRNILFGCVLFFLSCAPRPTANKPTTHIQFSTNQHDFGTFHTQTEQRCAFVFKNIGKNMLAIHRVETDCGCTTAEGPRMPVKPGAIDSIVVRYDGNGFLPGSFSKVISVYSNATDTLIQLSIKGTYYPE